MYRGGGCKWSLTYNYTYPAVNDQNVTDIRKPSIQFLLGDRGFGRALLSELKSWSHTRVPCNSSEGLLYERANTYPLFSPHS